MTVSILHLSDIHAGLGELGYEDGKAHVAGAERQKQLPRLASYLEALPRPPDFVVVSGDISIKGDSGGLQQFRDWLLDQIAASKLPEAGRIIVAPGNHDVLRQSRREVGERERFRDFWAILCKAFPHAHVPVFDPQLDPDTPPIDRNWGLIGGIRTRSRHGQVTLRSSLPFLLDLDLDILIFAFNSALGCGIPGTPDKDNILTPLESLANLHTDDGVGSALNKVKEAYLDSLVIDAGLIGDEQLQYFIALMRRMKAALGQRYTHLTKIATLHHHVSHLWDQQLEVKAFESVLDAAQLKRSLIENGFHFVLHGHKHTNHVGLDGSLIPLSETGPFTPLCIISGGTVGGNPRINDHQTFKLLTLDGKKGPRTRAKVSEIAIREVGNYANSINSDARVFNVPISQWLPPIQALAGALGFLDSVLVARLYLTLPVLHSLRDEYDPGSRDNALTDRIIELSQDVLSAFRDIMAGVLGLSAHTINCSVWLRSLSLDNVDASQTSVSPLAFSNPFDGRLLEDHKVYESTIAAALSGLNDNAGNVWSPQQSQCFCCNALSSNNFATPTPTWGMFFNSVLAFPIRKRVRGNNRVLKDYGYLRFDAPEPGVFANMPCAFQYKTEPWAYARRLEERPEFYLGGTMAHLLLFALDKPGAVLDEVSNAA